MGVASERGKLVDADAMARSYTREEVDEILRRAAASGGDGEPMLSREELVDAAREAGIDPGAVHAAADEVETGLTLERIPTGDEAVAAWEIRRRRRFTSHLLTWLVVCTGLLVLNLLSGGAFWFQWPLAGWGIAVALQAIRTFQSATPDQIARVKERHRKSTAAQRRRLASEQQRVHAAQRALAKERVKEQDRGRRQEAAALFEAAVEEGVHALMAAATRTLTDVAQRSRKEAPAPKKETDFDRYVARKKGLVPSEPERVPLRVDVPAERDRIETEEPEESPAFAESERRRARTNR